MIPPTTIAPSKLRAAGLGGGTGLPVTLAALRRVMFADDLAPVQADRLTAVVTVCDDGGSSGRLRARYPVIPFGDIRNCLLALARGDPERRALFGYRFDGAEDVGGHNLGNLILTALALDGGGAGAAVEWASNFLCVCGRVLPCTTESCGLAAQYTDGEMVVGESSIARPGHPIARVALWPRDPKAHPAAVRAIEKAHMVVLGPGSLFTSILPVLLVPQLHAALLRSNARIVLVANLMTEPGETDGCRASDMVRAIERHAPGLRIDDAVLHSGPFDPELVARYHREGARPVEMDVESVTRHGCRPICAELAASGPLARHDPKRLGRVLAALSFESPGGML